MGMTNREPEVTGVRVLGVIAEYNPFHNGHAFHLKAAREACGAEYAVCVISGCVTQRGEAALFLPEARARMALACGADAVLEIPCACTLADADRFALQGVRALSALGVVTHLGFGAETADLELLSEAARRVSETGGAFSEALAANLSRGMSFARARGEALRAQMGFSLCKPNDVLAVSYLKAIAQTGADMQPVVTPRAGAYHDTSLDPLSPSAKAVRRAMETGDWESARRAMPAAAFDIARAEALAGRVCPPNALDTVLAWSLRTAEPETLRSLPDMTEGLENRLKACDALTTREAILTRAKTKRYTAARLSRALAQLALGLDARLVNEPVTHAYLLGFRASAAPLLHAMARGALPLVTRAARAPKGESAALDRRAHALWALCAGLDTSDGMMRRRVVMSD